MAEQLLLSGNIDEKVLCSLNIAQARFDIGVALLSHSGTYVSIAMYACM